MFCMLDVNCIMRVALVYKLQHVSDDNISGIHSKQWSQSKTTVIQLTLEFDAILMQSPFVVYCKTNICGVLGAF